jgi:O-antigen/teichoic acid export membrane protein
MNLTLAPEDSAQITRKAGQGFIWNFLAYGLGRAVVLLTTSILARLLTKNDFGLVAIAVVAINYLSVVKDLGLGMALIQRRENVPEAANTVFTINLIIGFGLSAIVFPIAPFVATYFKDPMIVPVMRWMGTSFAINALGAVHINWLMRELDYRRKLIPDLGNSLIKGAFSIGMAYLGYGVWSLVFGQIYGAIASVVLVWIIYPWLPRLVINHKIAKDLLKFGSTVIGGDTLSVITDNIDYVIVGRLFGLVQLSIYTLAYRLPEMLLIGNLWVMGEVTYPVFSHIQDRPTDLRDGFLASVRLVQLFALPVCLGLFIAADPIIRVLFGNQWLDAIPVLRVLAVYAWVYSIGYHIGDVYKALGRPDISLKLSILTIIIIVPALLAGSRFGLIGIAWGHLTAVLIRRIISLTMASRFTEISIWDIFKELKSSFTGALIMIPLIVITSFLSASSGPFLQLFVVVLTGVISYLGIIWWIERENLVRLMNILRTKS